MESRQLVSVTVARSRTLPHRAGVADQPWNMSRLHQQKGEDATHDTHRSRDCGQAHVDTDHDVWNNAPERASITGSKYSMFHRILVATGGSPWSDNAVKYAIDLARDYGLELVILHVL